jgi:hypothetical protein
MKSVFFAVSLFSLLAFATPARAGNTCGAKLTTLQAAVDSACKPASKITCPSGGNPKTCAQLTELFNNARTCKANRVAVNKCFSPGPDQGHKTAVTMVGKNIIQCQRLMQTACAQERRQKAGTKK